MNTRFIKILPDVEEFIDLIQVNYHKYQNQLEVAEVENIKNISRETQEGEESPQGDTPTPNKKLNDKPTPTSTPGGKNDIDFFVSEDKERKKALEKKMKRLLVWRTKVMRFLTYCINGGLSDYILTYESFISLYNKCQTTNNDINEFIFYSMNVIDLDNQAGLLNEDGNSYFKTQIASLNDKSNFTFNEESLAVCIKSGWLSKYLSESWNHFPQFCKILITNHCSNKILSKIL